MIRITRGESPFSLAGCEIYIDGVCVYRGKLKEHETVEFEVDNGSHTVFLGVGVKRSNTLHVDVNDSIVELEVGDDTDLGERLLFPQSMNLYVKVKGTETEAQKARREEREEKERERRAREEKRPKWLQKIIDALLNN